MIPLILIGGGGHCKSVIDIIETEGKYKIIGILDLPSKIGEKVLGYDIIGTEDNLENFISLTNNFLVTVGHVKDYKTRERLVEKIDSVGGNLVTIISPLSHVSRDARIGRGSVIHHFAHINAGAKIGDNCIINSFANIEHDANIGNLTHISTSVMVNGDCMIGSCVFIGSNATLRIGAKITDNVTIGACSFVNSDITEPGFYKGIPAKKHPQ